MDGLKDLENAQNAVQLTYSNWHNDIVLKDWGKSCFIGDTCAEKARRCTEECFQQKMQYQVCRLYYI